MEDFVPPPSLTRISFPGDYTTNHDGHSKSDGSLDILTGEVMEAQKYQAHELSGKEDLLKELQVELHSITQVHETVQNDVKAVSRRMYLLQDEVCEKQNSCAQLQEDIVNQLEKKRRLQTGCCELKWSRSEENGLYTKYREKIRCYRENVQTFYQQSETQKKIIRLKNKIKEQQQILSQLSKHDILTANECVKVEQELTKLIEVETKLEDEVSEVEKQITNTKENLFIMKKETDALHKRNASQVTRLKQQLATCNENIKKWRVENKTLKEKIGVIKEKMVS